MAWFVLLHLGTLLVDLLTATRRTDRDKDLELLLLRHQLRLLQRERPRPPRLARWEQLTLALLTAKLAGFTAGARFRLLFGQTAGEAAAGASAGIAPAGAAGLFIPTPAVAGDLFGWGVIYALHARACIGRGRVWQAEHYVGAVRDHALALACLRHGLPAVQARGYDDLPAEALAPFGAAHVGAAEPGALRAALVAAAQRLADLADLP